MLSWNFINFGKRRFVLNERESEQKQDHSDAGLILPKDDDHTVKGVIEFRKMISPPA
jgi:hypothetical protein